jgi:hypothetical protein
VKIYVAAVEVLKQNERQDETQFTTKIGEKTSLGSNYFALCHSQFTQLMPRYAETGRSRLLIEGL